MKKTEIIKIFFFANFLLFSCVKTEDFAPPQVEAPTVETPANLTSIAAIKGNYDPASADIFTFTDTNTYIEGYVISSDEGGNFYKKLILQDKPQNPSSGIQILIDDAAIYNSFNFGRKLFIKLDGLSLWFNNGVYQLGVQNRGDVVEIPQALIDNFITRTAETANIEPLKLKISDFAPQYKNLFIRLEDVQFNRNLVRENNIYSFASAVSDKYDGERQLESCTDGATTTLSTSTFSDFKSLLLPTSRGNVEGVLTRNFYDDYYVVIVNSPEDLHFEGNERCDPVFLDCGNNISEGPKTIFQENFVGISNENILDTRGWTNVNVNGGNTRFVDGILNSDRFIRISAYNTKQNPLEAWLVTPSIDLDAYSAEVLSFDIKASFDNATILSVYITNNFTGDVRTTNWQLLDAQIPIGPTNQNGTNFKKNKIDISCLSGKVNIAFRYLGGDPEKTTTYDIDNIRVTGN
ncbi:MAG: DUF5689 domain-containing protein [Gillisia sp.]